VSGERRTALSSVALFLYVMALMLVVLAPGSGGPDRVLVWVTDLAQSAGAPGRSTRTVVEILLNVVLTAPATALASVVWPGPSWRDWTAWAFLAFSAVELVQGLLLPARNGSFSDVVANTAGCCLGALAVAAVRRVGERRAA
jgi:glycopeptide antibiotics resistance protein